MRSVITLISLISDEPDFRPPAVPLVTLSPYVSVWSPYDKLTDGWPQHWTGGIMGTFGMVRIDGKPYRFCGPQILEVPAMQQVSVRVGANASAYTYRAAGIELIVDFEQAVPENLNLPTDPITRVHLTASATDGKPHDVSAYMDFTGEWCTNTADQPITISRLRAGEQEILTIASAEQPVLRRAGDRVRIDWGTLYLWARNSETGFGADGEMRKSFAAKGTLPLNDETDFPKPANANWPVAALEISFGTVNARAKSERSLFIAYDERSSIEYFGRPLPPLWRSRHSLADLVRQSMVWRETAIDFGKSISREYAQILALAYRQCLAGHGLAQDINGDLLMFSKENTSNGCISTVDVIFPASPFFLYYSPELLKANLRPVLDYASMPRWRFPFAPHDLGTYPKANGQVYGGGEKSEENQMPVEESANMLLMMDALARVEKSVEFAKKYDNLLARWAEYLLKKGFDPENQLSTDDFTGHLAHNANLSIKAIVAIRAYADLLEMMGRPADAAPYKKTAAQWVKNWLRAADDGDHFRLAFDKPGTWSQKYNLVWDKLLGFNLFPKEAIRKELRFYSTKFNKYGLALDSRATFTKADWQIWTGSLTDTDAEFAPYVNTMYRMLNETRSRVPFTDWYDTVTGDTSGMYARTVVGGVYMKLLLDSRKLNPQPGPQLQTKPRRALHAP